MLVLACCRADDAFCMGLENRYSGWASANWRCGGTSCASGKSWVRFVPCAESRRSLLINAELTSPAHTDEQLLSDESDASRERRTKPSKRDKRR